MEKIMLKFSDIQPVRDDTPNIKVVGVGGGGVMP